MAAISGSPRYLFSGARPSGIPLADSARAAQKDAAAIRAATFGHNRAFPYFCTVIWPFNRKKQHSEPDMKKFLIAGLGNIGAEYVNTRHNIGFKIADALVRTHGEGYQTAKLGALAPLKIKGKTVFVLKPNTYMNLSGKAVQYWLQQEKIPIENLIVVTDDLNIPFGTIRIKGKGSDGGHNGLKSLNEILGRNDYARFRFGIGDEFKKGRQVDYVLGEWDAEENQKLPERLQQSVLALESFVNAGLANTMSEFNGK